MTGVNICPSYTAAISPNIYGPYLPFSCGPPPSFGASEFWHCFNAFAAQKTLGAWAESLGVFPCPPPFSLCNWKLYATIKLLPKNMKKVGEQANNAGSVKRENGKIKHSASRLV